MKNLGFVILALRFFVSSTSAAPLFDQSIAIALENGFPSPDISYLLLEATTGTVVAARWEDVGQALPFGSIVKPFAALAYAKQHGLKYPEFVCKGTASGCWFPRGHGRIDIAHALAFSCNAYFQTLAAAVPPEDLSAIVASYGVHSGVEGLPSRSFIGLGNEWRILPKEIAQAYCRLANDSRAPGVAELFQGLVLTARSGTAKSVGRAFPNVDTLAKTGTAPCNHQPRGPGDGYMIALYPAEIPRLALLVRVHGVPGCQAAVLGSQMLRMAVDGR